MQSKVAARMASAVTGQSVCAIANPRYYKPLPITSLDTEKYPRATECAVLAFDYARLRSRHPHAPRCGSQPTRGPTSVVINPRVCASWQGRNGGNRASRPVVDGG